MLFKPLIVTAFILALMVQAAEPYQTRELPRRLYIGPYESDATVGGATGLKDMINRIRPYGMNALTLGTRVASQDLFDVISQEQFYFVFKAAYDLERRWWDSAIANTEQGAADAADFITSVATPYLVGYDLKDEPGLNQAGKLCRIIDAVKAKDPAAAATALLVGLNRGDILFERCRPDTLYIDVYPFMATSAVGDFSMHGFGYPELDFVEYIRHFTEEAHPDIQLWVLLQTHGTDWPGYKLRAPTKEELRAMQWMALGEGATGIFYFHWGSMQTWVGLKDNPELFAEAASFAQAVRPHEDLIVSWRRQDAPFAVSDNAYVSTLEDTRDEALYAVVVNRDVTASNHVDLTSPLEGELLDVTTGERHGLNSSLILAPGEGKIFKFIPLRESKNRRTE